MDIDVMHNALGIEPTDEDRRSSDRDLERIEQAERGHLVDLDTYASMVGGLVPTLRREFRNAEPTAVIVEPEHLAGIVVVGVRHLDACRIRFPAFNSCGLVAGHHGPCWICSDELIAQEGPFAMVRGDDD